MATLSWDLGENRSCVDASYPPVRQTDRQNNGPSVRDYQTYPSVLPGKDFHVPQPARELVPRAVHSAQRRSRSTGMEYSGAGRPAWSAPASPRWAVSSSTGSELAGGVDAIADVVEHLEFADSSSTHDCREAPPEWPPAKRLRPIMLPGQRESPPLTAPAPSLTKHLHAAASLAKDLLPLSPCLQSRRWRRATRTSCAMHRTRHRRHRRR